MDTLKLTKEEIIKAEVLGASRQLFKRYGYQKTTMEDIARAIGRGKSTLYYYYKSKEEIFEAIVLREAKELFSVVSKKVEKASTAEEKLKTYVLTAYEVMKEKAVLNDVIFNEMVQAGGANAIQPSMGEHLGKFNEKWFLIMREILVFGVDNNEFGEGLLAKVDVVSKVMVTNLLSTVLSMVHFGGNVDENDFGMQVSEIFDSLVDILINGLK